MTKYLVIILCLLISSSLIAEESKKKEMTDEEKKVQLLRLYYPVKTWISEVPSKEEKEIWTKKHEKDENVQDDFFTFCSEHKHINSDVKREDLIHFTMTFCKIMESETFIIPGKVQDCLTEQNVDIAIKFLLDQIKDAIDKKNSTIVEKESKK